MTVVDGRLRHGVPGAVDTFQSLLLWMTVVDVLACPLAGTRLGFQSLLLWMTVVDDAFGPVAVGLPDVSILVVVDDGRRHDSTGHRRLIM